MSAAAASLVSTVALAREVHAVLTRCITWSHDVPAPDLSGPGPHMFAAAASLAAFR